MEQLLLVLEQNPYIKPAAYILGSILIGIIFQTIILGKLRQLAKKTKWAWDDVVIKGLDHLPIVWFALGGIYLAFFDSVAADNYKMLAWQFLLIAFVISVAVVMARLAVGLINLYAEKTHGGLPVTSIFTILTKILIYTLAILMILQTFGISITPFLTALGVGGLAVALALQETLSNLFAGIHMIASKKFRPGDYIELDADNSGFIEDISWRNTTIRTLGSNLVIIPNQKIASATLVNYSRPQKEMSVLIKAGVGYNSDLEHVEKVVIEVGKEIMKKVTGGVQEFVPFIRFNEFGDSSINFTVILRVQEFTNQYLIKHEFVKALHKRFKEERIEIPFPQRDVHMVKGE